MRGPRKLETALSVLASVCIVAFTGCGASHDLPDRHARQFIPFDSAWISESEVPEEPQTSPSQVVWEFTAMLDEPGPAERTAAQEWVERCYESAKRHGWDDYAKGLADGFEKMLARDPYHYRNREYVLDDRILDPDRPEFLMYYPKPDGTHGLAGFMFITRNLEERGPQFAGRLTIWHYHVWAKAQCVERDVIALDFAQRDGSCYRGEPRHRSPEMLHTWLIDHPRGAFATSMILGPQVFISGLEKRMRERGF
jgi:hypothetical protein